MGVLTKASMGLLSFTKMHGLGNDYVYINCFRQTLPVPATTLARYLSDRRFGVGSDGLILILPSSVADCRMEMYNADGSRAEMCGNGIRCVGKLVFDTHIARKPLLRVETDAGVKELQLQVENGWVTAVTVDMGPPRLAPQEIPTTLEGSRVVEAPLKVGESVYRVTCVSMGNPHCVVFSEKVDQIPLERIGPDFERHEVFPRRINTEFVQCLSKERLRVRVWERGSGETLACGTGACAAVVAAVLTDRCRREARVELRGGELAIRWSEDNDHVYLTGPAVRVYDGELIMEELLRGLPPDVRGQV